MADPSPSVNPLFLREEDLRRGVELLNRAARLLAETCDGVLAEQQLGRAHHRALGAIGRNPGMTVSALIDCLSVTKQSLNPILNDLIQKGFVKQDAGLTDRRQRVLSLTESGMALEKQLFRRQREALARAYRDAGAEAVQGFRQVLETFAGDPD